MEMSGTIVDHIIEIKDSLPKKQRQLCNYIVLHSGEAGMMTVAELAQHAGVGTTTVMRLVQDLGYDSYNRLKRDIMSASMRQLGSSYGNRMQTLSFDSKSGKAPSFPLPPAVSDSQLCLPIGRGHPEEGGNPHPENGARASRQQSGGHAGNVPCTDSSSQRRAGRLKLGNFFLLPCPFRFLTQVPSNASCRRFPPVKKAQKLESAKTHAIPDSHQKKGQKHRRPPDQTMNRFHPVLPVHPIFLNMSYSNLKPDMLY